MMASLNVFAFDLIFKSEFVANGNHNFLQIIFSYFSRETK